MNDDASADIPCDDPRIYLAAERTLLAWVRTGLAMMGFGFVVARFGMFLHELALARDVPPPRQFGFSLAVGTLLVLLGVLVQIGAAVQHWRNIRSLLRGRSLEFHPFSLGTATAALLSIIGLAMTAFLLFVNR